MNKHIACIIGTRPEAIKIAPIVNKLRERRDLRTTLIATGQHRDLVHPALASFGLGVDADLGCSAEDRSLTELHAGLLCAIDRRLAAHPADMVIGQGDTLSAAAAAMAAFYRRIPFAHVEAGLRSGRTDSPFPEEFSRQAISLCANLHFAPTRSAAAQLVTEGIAADDILVSGNSVIDALLEMAKQVRDEHPDRPSILFTLHRRENLAVAGGIFAAVGDVARARPGIDIVYPVHPNPAIASRAHAALSTIANVRLTAPLPYPELVRALKRAMFVVTDSGGLQEEGPALNKPVLVVRDVSERPESIASGAARLIGTDRAMIVREMLRLIDDPDARARMTPGGSPYGDGQAARRIAMGCVRYLGLSTRQPIDEFSG